MHEMIVLREAEEHDAGAISDIYRHYVCHTAVSFDLEVPSTEELSVKILRTLERYPFLVALDGETIVGYTYASPFKNRPAYDRCVETTIYLHKDFKRKGVGRALYTALENELKRQGVLNLEACIAVTDRKKDGFLNDDSPLFHQKMGYRTVALFRNCGRKFGQWYDVIWMEKFLGEHSDSPLPFVPYGMLKNRAIDQSVKE